MGVKLNKEKVLNQHSNNKGSISQGPCVCVYVCVWLSDFMYVSMHLLYQFAKNVFFFIFII